MQISAQSILPPDINDSLANKIFMIEVISGLSQPQKQLPAKFFYDSAGSALFDEICQLEEYYPYRTEMAMLPGIAEETVEFAREVTDVVEFGAGSLQKIEILLDCMPHIKRFFPIDIAGDHLRNATLTLQQKFSRLQIHPVEADFTQRVPLPDRDRVRKLGFFPGSTIGNFNPEHAIEFLDITRQSLGQDALLLIGVDTKKTPTILHAAYNDRLGVTAKFNRNMLTHINKQTGANFVPKKFDHYAFYDPAAGRVEMHLVSQEKQAVTVGNRMFKLNAGESIHTESSYKYTPAEFIGLARVAGWRGVKSWIADQGMYSLHLLTGAF